MVAYSFKEQFIKPIRKGLGLPNFNAFGVDINDADPALHLKRQTIRANRKRHVRPGETMQLYYGMRTKACLLIARARCISVEPISIDFEYRFHPTWVQGRIEHGDPFHVCQGQENLDNFAVSDGFTNWAEMRKFWQQTHPGLDVFKGVLLRWEPIQ